MPSSSAISITGSVSNFFTRNRLINGSFTLWQRGLTFGSIVDGVTKANIYTADRWIALNGGGSATVTRGSFTRNQTSVPEYPEYYYNYRMLGVTKSGTPAIMQKIDDVTKFAGKTVTLSFYGNVSGITASASAGITTSYLPATIRVRQYLGSGASGGGMTHDTIQYTKSINIMKDTWQRYSASFYLSNLSGKTLGTVGTDFTSFELRLPMVVSGGSPVSYLPGGTFGDPDVHAGFTSANVTGYTLGYTLGFANAQVDIGYLSAYERRDLATELQLAQQYYRKTFPYDITPGNSSGYTAGALLTTALIPTSTSAVSYNLNPKMRTTPSVTFYSIRGNTNGWATAAASGPTGSVMAVSSENLMIGSTTGSIAANSYIHLAADAEI